MRQSPWWHARGIVVWVSRNPGWSVSAALALAVRGPFGDDPASGTAECVVDEGDGYA